MWPTPSILPMVTITPFSLESCLGSSSFNGGNIGMDGYSSTVWPAANNAYFYPFLVSKQFTFATMFWMNAVTVAGNVDIGVYNSDGVRLVSKGSTAMSGASGIQVVTVTSTTLPVGRYYMAMASDSATATFATYVIGQVLKTKFTGMAQQATAFALPTTAALATMGNDYIPLFGLSTRSSI